MTPPCRTHSATSLRAQPCNTRLKSRWPAGIADVVFICTSLVDYFIASAANWRPQHKSFILYVCVCVFCTCRIGRYFNDSGVFNVGL